MATELTHKYFPKIAPREENLFVEEYYCSTDTKIYMDDIEQTEIAYISYSMQEQLKPLYGYASNTFDDVAIGNRIVTGMFKVPIKNPEANADINTVYNETYGLDTIDPSEVYNQDQENLKDTIEWIENNKPGTSDNTDTGSSASKPDYDYSTIDNEEELIYLSKLLELGYDLEYGSTKQELIAAIKKFQKENRLESNGDLNEETKKEIDNKYENIKLDQAGKTITLPPGTNILYEPNGGVAYTLTKQETVTIIDDSIDGWYYIVLEDGVTVGYVEKQEVV